MSNALILVALLTFTSIETSFAAEFGEATAGSEAELSPEQQTYVQKLQALNWIKGPTTVAVGGNSDVDIPEGFMFLEQADAARFLELNQNLSSGREVMIAPESLEWQAYLTFEAEGYVKDDEKIDAEALLKAMQESQTEQNKERRKRGWSDLVVKGWAVRPTYNKTTQRLEWATLLSSDGGEGTNFFTKILGRRGHTSIQMVADVNGLPAAEATLDGILDNYRFRKGEKYAEWIPGDKVAEYGLAAMVLGGAAAVATKKGFWALLAGFFAAAWKFVAVGAMALLGALKSLFKKKSE